MELLESDRFDTEIEMMNWEYVVFDEIDKEWTSIPLKDYMRQVDDGFHDFLCQTVV